MEDIKENPSRTLIIKIVSLVMLSLVAIGMAITLLLLYTGNIEISDGSEYYRAVSIDMDTGLFAIRHKDSKNLADAVLHRIAIGLSYQDSDIDIMLNDSYMRALLEIMARLLEIDPSLEAYNRNVKPFIQTGKYEGANVILRTAFQRLSILKGIFVPCLPAIVEIIGMNKDAFGRMVDESFNIWIEYISEMGRPTSSSK
ncbi:hypothetical protein BdWA1_002579 [Babesia duncani]|uniref:Uncharacterized protein n=1 Tax=Babesia duncani TaxID=323732 RepID=A0AAD9PJZ1_9APIC|nr:hypothetical protein BdWA1_002579 [Babesia duncani]